MSPDKIKHYNQILLHKLSLYLNLRPDFINESMIEELTIECHLETKEAFSILLAEVLGLDTIDNIDDHELYHTYFPDMIHKLTPETYQENPYYKNIKIPSITYKDWTFKTETYQPYEAFVCNDLKLFDDGRIIPQIGFFDSSYFFPAILQHNREWMLITPNEIETMKEPIEAAHGNVLTYGLGLGYFAYMASQKKDVTNVTIIENNADVIHLFRTYLLPQFQCKEKIQIIRKDAFAYAKTQMLRDDFDFVFVDLWHDASDGISMYLKMKELENQHLQETRSYRYWIEKTIQCYV